MAQPASSGPGARAGSSAGAVAFSGAVLAGGASRRFGEDKAAYAYRGRTLLEHALAALDGASDRMVVGAAAPAGSRARSVPDVRPGFGAVSGVHASLAHAERPWVAVMACDMPFVPPALWAFLLDVAEGPPRGDVQIVVPEGPRGVEPLAGIYRRDLLPVLDARLDAGGLAVRDLLACAPSRIVPWSQVRERFDARTFLNANRPGDLP